MVARAWQLENRSSFRFPNRFEQHQASCYPSSPTAADKRCQLGQKTNGKPQVTGKIYLTSFVSRHMTVLGFSVPAEAISML